MHLENFVLMGRPTAGVGQRFCTCFFFPAKEAFRAEILYLLFFPRQGGVCFFLFQSFFLGEPLVAFFPGDLPNDILFFLPFYMVSNKKLGGMI